MLFRAFITGAAFALSLIIPGAGGVLTALTLGIVGNVVLT